MEQAPNNKKKAVFGIYKSRGEIKIAKSALKATGFSNGHVSILYPPHPGPKDFPQWQTSLVGRGALIGAFIGALVFVMVSLFSSSVPPVEEVIASVGVSDRILLTIVGVISGIIFGAACGALVGIGTPESAGNRYGDYVGAGGILMSVHIDHPNQERLAREVLERTGASDISLLKEGQGWEAVYAKMLQQNHHQIAHT